MTIDELIHESHAQACKSGWWVKGQERTFGDLIALCHSELSEALEDYRARRETKRIYHNDKTPTGIPIELADLFIRVADLCGAYDIDLNAAIRLKMQYNTTRPERHGGKAI